MTHAQPKDHFSDLVSDLDADGGEKVVGSNKPDNFHVGVFNKDSKPKLARFPCPKCCGSGLYTFHSSHGHHCFKCKGSGLVKTDPAKAAARREAKEKKRLELLGRAMLDYTKAHPIVIEWIDANCRTFDFAGSLSDAFRRYGSLTENQTAAVYRCIEGAKKREQERAARKPDADVQGAGFTRMVEAFGRANASGLRSPKFRVEAYTFAPAKASSKNPGCIYVTREGQYLGKIDAAGKYWAAREATTQDHAEITRIGADPLAAAVMHGKKTGNCSCCGRHLENAESVELGIGPICRAKWGL